jgi:hypothetical protein
MKGRRLATAGQRLAMPGRFVSGHGFSRRSNPSGGSSRTLRFASGHGLHRAVYSHMHAGFIAPGPV